MAVLMTGGSGTLGKELKRHIECIAPARSELDITDRDSVAKAIKRHRPRLIIHLAAMTDVRKCEEEKSVAYAVNVIGTRNLMELSESKLVYISTDYVFDGKAGNYRENDTVNPVNYYSLTKLLGEEIVRCRPGNLVIRTSFVGEGAWPFPKAFTDKFTSADRVSVIAHEVSEAIRIGASGILHIGTGRKSMYDLAKTLDKDVGKISLKDVDIDIPKDTSLNTERWERMKDENKKA